MNRVHFRSALILGLLLSVGGVGAVQSGMMSGHMGHAQPTPEPPSGGMMGHGGMGKREPRTERGMRGVGMSEGGGMHQPGQLTRMLTAELELSDEQAKQVRGFLVQIMKVSIQQQAEIRIAELELQELLQADPVDMARVESQLKAVEGRRTALLLTVINAHEQAKAVLTPEQRQKLERIHDRLPGMMRHGLLDMMER